VLRADTSIKGITLYVNPMYEKCTELQSCCADSSLIALMPKGRPKKQDKDRKDEPLNVKVTPAVKARYQRIANAISEGNLSFWVRQTLDAAATEFEQSQKGK